MVTVFNRRNAAVGWIAWRARKRLLKHMAKDAAPALDANSKRPNKSAVALLIAGAVGVGTFLQRRSGDEETGAPK